MSHRSKEPDNWDKATAIAVEVVAWLVVAALVCLVILIFGYCFNKGGG